ncbi:segregation and condensation protein A [Candidatus Margulisiibacteriota bacterium]
MRRILPGIKKDMEKELEGGEDVSRLSAYKVKIEVFEGPFDLLLHMIDEDKIDLYQVSLTKITQGYLDYIKTLDKFNIVVASEFLLMAAYLLEMKSKMLLPVKEEEKVEEGLEIENIEELLAERLAEYKIYKGLADDLRKRKDIFQKVHSRYTPEDAAAAQEFFLVDVSLRDLVIAFKKVWDDADARGDTVEIVAENISINDKIKDILGRVKKKKDGVKFESFFEGASKLTIIVTFLAMLELIRQKLIKIKQSGLFGGILIYGAEG